MKYILFVILSLIYFDLFSQDIPSDSTILRKKRTSIEVLLSFGTDKKTKTKQGETALHFANKMQWEHIISVLEK